MYRPTLLLPNRLRVIDPPFGWSPFRLLTSGLLTRLSSEAHRLYHVLSLVADRKGLSFYSDMRLMLLLQLDAQQLDKARSELILYDLLAFDGRVYQLLSLPAAVAACRADTQGMKDILCRLGFRGD